jgi:hypothetical protein
MPLCRLVTLGLFCVSILIPSMSTPEPNFSAYVDQTAALMGLSLSPESRTAVIRNITLLHSVAQPVMTVTLSPADDPSPVFSPDCPSHD